MMTARINPFAAKAAATKITDSAISVLSGSQQVQVSGGAQLSGNGLAATTALEVEAVLSGRNGQVMVIVDGVIMNKDELGLI